MDQNINPRAAEASPPLGKRSEESTPAKDNHAVSKRLQKELMELMRSADKGVSAFPEGDNLFRWVGTIAGPPGTAYAGHTYRLALAFPQAYPYAPPAVRFLTPCFHPNVDAAGLICLDILKEQWSALYDVRSLLLSLQSLLAEPNTRSPLNQHAAALWADPVAYKQYLDQFYNKNKES